MSGIADVLRDLRRRKVFRGTGFYIVGAWSIIQVMDVLGDPLGLPSWTIDALLFMAVVGFPLAVWVAWRYELSDGALVRTAPATADETAAADLSLGALDYLVLVALVAMAGFVGWRGLESIRLTSEAEEAATVAAPAAVEAEENTIAVLPFVDLSPGSDQGFLADGVADTVLFVLSRVPELQVTARTSSFAFRGEALTAAQIAAALGVAHILEGSVQRIGDQLRIIARVIDARTNRELWSANYDRPVDELFAVQDEIAESVAAALKVSVVDAGEETVAAYQPSLEAHEQFILGKLALETQTSEQADAAVGHMERAVALDPAYGRAHIGLHDALLQQTLIGGGNPMALKPKLEGLIDQAIELDPTLAEAWVARSRMLGQEKRFSEAQAALEKALELNPNLPEAHAALWNQLMFVGDREAQLVAIRKAVELDPESADYQLRLAMTLWSLARAEEAMAITRENIQRHPEHTSSYQTLARWHTQYGRAGEGMRYLQALRARDPGNMQVWKQTCEQFLHFWDAPGAEACYRAYLEQNPDDLDAQKWLIYATTTDSNREDGLRRAIAIGEREVERAPNFWYPRVQLADNLLFIRDYERAIDLLSQPFPQLLGPEPEINDLTQWPARLLAEALWKAGRRDEAEPLLDGVMAWIERSRKEQAGGWIAGTEDAMIHCIREETEPCLDALERVVDSGWLFYSFRTDHQPAYESVWDEPRFAEIIDKLKTNAGAERDYWYEKQDEPVI